MPILQNTTVFIVDDERLARARLKRLIENSDTHTVCGEAENGEQALQEIPKLKPDIVMLDIRMPGIDGLDVAEKLAELKHPPAIIFCTAYDEYAIEAFRYKAIGYLLKPASAAELNQALSQATQLNQLQIKQLKTPIQNNSLQKMEEKPNFVAHTWQGHELIPFDSIYFFRSDQKYLTVAHREGETLSDQTLKELEQLYPNDLIRVHRNTLVNKIHIAALSKNNEGHYQIQIRNSHYYIGVSRRHVTGIKRKIEDLI